MYHERLHQGQSERAKELRRYFNSFSVSVEKTTVFAERFPIRELGKLSGKPSPFSEEDLPPVVEVSRDDVVIGTCEKNVIQ